MFQVAVKRRFSFYRKSMGRGFGPSLQLAMVRGGGFVGPEGWPIVLHTDLEFTLLATISDSVRECGES